MMHAAVLKHSVMRIHESVMKCIRSFMLMFYVFCVWFKLTQD